MYGAFGVKVCHKRGYLIGERGVKAFGFDQRDKQGRERTVERHEVGVGEYASPIYLDTSDRFRGVEAESDKTVAVVESTSCLRTLDCGVD